MKIIIEILIACYLLYFHLHFSSLYLAVVAFGSIIMVFMNTDIFVSFCFDAILYDLVVCIQIRIDKT